jgi:hypothetical protein
MKSTSTYLIQFGMVFFSTVNQANVIPPTLILGVITIHVQLGGMTLFILLC